MILIFSVELIKQYTRPVAESERDVRSHQENKVTVISFYSVKVILVNHISKFI